MTDLVETLRRSYWIGDNVTTAALAEEAADEIERLRGVVSDLAEEIEVRGLNWGTFAEILHHARSSEGSSDE